MKKLLKISLIFSLATSAMAQNSSAGTISADNWCPPEAAVWISAIGALVIGCFAALLGLLSKGGKARGFVLRAWIGGIVFGILCLIATVVGFITNQPWYIIMPLCLFGILPTTILSVLLPGAKKHYDDLEIRRMASMDN